MANRVPLKVHQLIEPGTPPCAPDESLQPVAERMCRWGCDVMPVCRADRRLVGLLTNRAICLQACMRGEPLSKILVRDALFEAPLFATGRDGVWSTLQTMVRERVWQLPVVDADGRLMGMVSYGRLLQAISGAREVLVLIGNLHAFDGRPPDYEFVPTWTLVTGSRELVSAEGEPAQLSRAEARLLLVLAKNAGAVMSREVLTREVVRRTWQPADRYVDVLVAHLRRKFGERGADARIIRTVPNDGYVFTPKVVDERSADGRRPARFAEGRALSTLSS